MEERDELTILDRLQGLQSMDYITVKRDNPSMIVDIELPSNFKTVIMKLHPEIQDVVADDCKDIKKYNPNTFDPVAYFQVGVKVFFPQDGVPKGNKEYYKKSFDELFIMTYGGEMDFVSFNVISLVVPPPKSNEEKFMELFGKK
jgi:hypothetical protein